MIGNTEISASGDNPFAGYEGQILNLIGVNPDYYKIDSIVWDGEPWTENGILYRKAIANGRKQVADCLATYGGLATLDEASGHIFEAIYQLNTSASLYTIQASATYVPANLWEFIKALFRNPVVIAATVCILLLIIMVVLILFLFAKGKQEKKDDNKHYKKER